VANRFALLQGSALHGERTWLSAGGPVPPALRTGLLLAQGVGLLFQEGLQGAFGQAGGGGVGDLFHGIQTDVEPGPFGAEGAPGNALAPLGRETLDLLELLGGEGAACQDASRLGVEKTTKERADPVKVQRRA
jgi:hypothetical protein